MPDDDEAAGLPDAEFPDALLRDARAQKAIADSIEAAIESPASIEEELLLEAAELLEVEFPEL